LVKLLALSSGHRLHREQVMDLLWPNSGRKAASNNLRRVLHTARRILDPVEGSRYLASHEETLVLCPRGDLWLDVEAFEEAAATARRARDLAAYRAALDLYAGDVLPEDRYEEWAEPRREELRSLYIALRFELAGLYEEHGGYEPAVEALRRVIAEEPTNEEAHAGLMRLHALSGRPGQAFSQYDRLREILSKQLGTEPGTAIRSLHEDIVTGRFPTTSAQPADPSQEAVADPTKHNLPAPRDSFVGREREITEVKRELAMTRLLTLTGVGGSGKTRLALEVARDLVGSYPDGVWLVELAPLSEGALVPQALAGALRVREQPDQPLTDTLVDALRPKNVLLVLDNCEHLIDATARLVDVLLDHCSHVRVLATSREALDVAGEARLSMLSLSVPDLRRSLTVAELEGSAAARLFVERASDKRSDFKLEHANTQTVAQICRRLDGVPLAIELAAARVGALSVERINVMLEDSLGFLTGGGRTAVPRQRTLRGTLDWSYELLDERERILFRRLSAFAGGWTLNAAKAVASGEDVEQGDVLELLYGLVDKSLVVAETIGESSVRHRLLEPVRQYARAKLEESEEAEAVRRRHAEYFLALVEEAEPGLLMPTARLLEHLETEHDNLRAVLSWAIDRREAELGQRLAGGLRWFWFARGHFGEGRRWLKELLQIDGPAGARVKALLAMSWLAYNQDDMDEAWTTAEAGLDLSAGIEGEGSIQAELLNVLGSSADAQGDHERAIRLYAEAIALSREAGDQWSLSFNLNSLGTLWVEEGNYAQATKLFEECVTLLQQLGDLAHLAIVLSNLGYIALLEGNHERATALSEHAATLFREQGHKTGLDSPLHTLGWVALLRGDHNQARTLYKESLILGSEAGSIRDTLDSLEALACVAEGKGEARRAARLFGAAETLNEVLGACQDIAGAPLQEPYVAVVRSRVDVAVWEKAWAEGRAMTFEEAVEYALSEEEPAPPLPSAPEQPSADEVRTLTRREKEVAALLAWGLTNRQIALELSISEHTAATHVRRILKKLGLQSRSQIGS
jgi:predicted ATPase/DNA-binding SARP family transcriptional activator/DNA-binding CsgD family transcriptional regulator